MLAQHLITRPVFEALFAGYDFAATTPSPRRWSACWPCSTSTRLDNENQSLEKFYDSVRARLTASTTPKAAALIVELYDTFFATAFKKTVDKLGIVYTPVEIVDFILNAPPTRCCAHFGQGLTDEGVHILDGFTGTGTFITRLLQLGLIKPEDLARKYANELHANEILLLAYYIAAVNIETTYHDIMRGSSATRPLRTLPRPDPHRHLPVWEDGDKLDLDVFPENNERLEKLKALPITVIIGNPPYSVGQDSANDNNANEKYPTLDAAIRDTYAAGPPRPEEQPLRLLHPRHQVGLPADQGPRRHRLRHQRRLARLQHRRRHAQDPGRGVQRHPRRQPPRQPAHRRVSSRARRAARSSAAAPAPPSPSPSSSNAADLKKMLPRIPLVRTRGRSSMPGASWPSCTSATSRSRPIRLAGSTSTGRRARRHTTSSGSRR
jgi:hypothetical protein